MPSVLVIAVERVGERGDLALRLEHELLREIAIGDGGDDLDDTAHLRGEVRGHEVDVVGEVLPHARHAAHLGLATELALGADFFCDARDLGGEGVELVDHRVDGVLELEHLALGVDGDLLRERSPFATDVVTSAMLRTCAVRLFARTFTFCVRSFQMPDTPGHLRLAAELAVGANLACDAGDLGGKCAQLIDHRVDARADAQELAFDGLAVDVERHLLRTRSPSATAMMTRATSVVGCTRSPMSALMEPAAADQLPFA